MYVCKAGLTSVSTDLWASSLPCFGNFGGCNNSCTEGTKCGSTYSWIIQQDGSFWVLNKRPKKVKRNCIRSKNYIVYYLTSHRSSHQGHTHPAVCMQVFWGFIFTHWLLQLGTYLSPAQSWLSILTLDQKGSNIFSMCPIHIFLKTKTIQRMNNGG